jgi:type II secretion system protein D
MFLHPRPSLIPLAVLVAASAGTLPSLQAQADRAQGEMVKLTFPNADIRDVLTQYELLVGKHVIYDNTVQGQVNINVPEVPKEEAIRIIEITLLMNGYHLVPSDSDPNLIKAIGVGRSPRQVGVPILAEPEPIPEGEQVIMYLVKLQYADPTELAQVLQQAMPASRQEYAPNIVPLPKAQALIITENTAILRGVMRIIRAADLEPTKVEGEFITLQRASAKDVVQMLEKLFEKPQTGAGTAAPRPAAPKPSDGAGAPPAPGAAASQLTTVEFGGMNEDSMLSGKVRLTADERTNRIYLVSRPVNLPVLRKLIQEFDMDVPFNEPMVRPLKFVSAGDILDALVKAVSDPGTKDAGATGATSTTGQRPQSPTPAPAQSPFGNLQGNRGLSSSSSSQGLSLQTEPREIIPQTVLVGNARIMADKRRNAILVIGSTDVKEKVANILERLDVRTPQVMLTTVIGELTLSEGQEMGVSYLLHNGKREALTGTTVNTGTVETATPGVVSVANNVMSLNLQQLLSNPSLTRAMTGGAGGMGGFVSVGDSLNALVTALESTTKFKVTSRPSLFASNNKKASIISGERIAVITGMQSGLGTTSNLVQQNQVSYIDVNLSLEVVPLINSDKEVYLDIVQNLAERTGESVIDNNKYPIISNRQLQTAVMVPNEGTLVLGGLIKDRRDRTTSGIPVLSKAPLIGRLFRSTSENKTRTELVILIRPSVSIGPEDTYDIRDRNMRPLRIPATLEDELTLPEPVPKKEQKKLSQKNFRSSPDGVVAQAGGAGVLQTVSAAQGEQGEQVSASAAVDKVAPQKASKGQPKASAE